MLCFLHGPNHEIKINSANPKLCHKIGRLNKQFSSKITRQCARLQYDFIEGLFSMISSHIGSVVPFLKMSSRKRIFKLIYLKSVTNRS